MVRHPSNTICDESEKARERDRRTKEIKVEMFKMGFEQTPTYWVQLQLHNLSKDDHIKLIMHEINFTSPDKNLSYSV